MFGLSRIGGRRSVPSAAAALSPVLAQPQGAWCSGEEAIMGTAIRVELWHDDPAAGHAAIAEVMAEMHRIDAAMSPHRPDSELSRINADAGTSAVPLSEEMTHLLCRAEAFARLSGGAFDITYAAVGQLYDYRKKTLPTAAVLAAARCAVGHHHLFLDRGARTLRFGRPGMRIDLGGFAKGHAVDRAAAILRGLGVAHAYISAGGDSRVIGDRRGRPWSIAIRDPRHADAVCAVLPLEDVSVSTSGDYERYFHAADGTRHHHLIDPGTGRSPTSVCSVTVMAEDGLTTEALSKAVFVLGVQHGLRLIESLPGVDAVVVDAAGTLHFSAGMLQAPNATWH